MKHLIFFLGILYMMNLIYEHYSLSKARKGFKHIIHVNGIRGKSTVCRLIDAGLREGGRNVFTKTTGTSPRMLYVDGSEHIIKRRGRANIKEQIAVIRKARAQSAEILVIECMAVKPELQVLSQEKLVAADISVITNVRPDHLDEMGKTLDEIAESLSAVIPKKGMVFTADLKYFEYFRKIAEMKDSQAFYAEEGSADFGKIDFADNVSLALEVCEALGVDNETALKGMSSYKKDPGSIKVCEVRNKANRNLTFVNALAANDPESTEKIMEKFYLRTFQSGTKRVLLINNRRDRLMRVKQFCDFTLRHIGCFDAIWLCGPLKRLTARMLMRAGISKCQIKEINSIEELEQSLEDAAVFAVGNIGGFGRELVKYMEEAGDVIGR